MQSYWEIFLRAILTFIGLLILTLLMGRKQLSQITFFDYTVGITIGSIAAVIAVDASVPVLNGAIALGVWAIMPVLLGFISLKSILFRRLVDGEPRIIIQNGVILNKSMHREKYNMGDLLMQLRDKGVFDISQVDFAILEPNGKLSVLKKPPFQTPTQKDMQIPSEYKGLMLELIIDSQVIPQSLNALGKDLSWLQEQLRGKNVTDIKDVVFAGWPSGGPLYISLRNRQKGLPLV